MYSEEQKIRPLYLGLLIIYLFLVSHFILFYYILLFIFIDTAQYSTYSSEDHVAFRINFILRKGYPSRPVKSNALSVVKGTTLSFHSCCLKVPVICFVNSEFSPSFQTFAAALCQFPFDYSWATTSTLPVISVSLNWL